jgi:hypothetical protein
MDLTDGSKDLSSTKVKELLSMLIGKLRKDSGKIVSEAESLDQKSKLCTVCGRRFKRACERK